MPACALWVPCYFHVCWDFFSGSLWQLGGCGLCTADLLGVCVVVLMVVPARGGFLGEHFWEMVGVTGCLWQVSPTPLGRACWRCLVVLFRLGVPLRISGLGGDALHPLCVIFWWAGCVGGCGHLTFVVGLWWYSVDV